MSKEQIVESILARLEASGVDEQWQRRTPRVPTRYAIIDDLLDAAVAQQIYEAFPRDAEGFITLKSFREYKRTSVKLDQHPAILSDIVYGMQDPRVLAAISRLTGIEDLEGDPNIYAGGLSMMFKGQFLNPHIDNSHDGKRNRYRRINLLYYVTPDWARENGGNLELWDKDVSEPLTIVSKFNRLALMETNRTSWHSVSPVLIEGARCCVSNYYFTEASPEEADYYHVTSYTGRPEQRMRRVLGAVDNSMRQFARQHLGMTKPTDEGYQGQPQDRDRAN